MEAIVTTLRLTLRPPEMADAPRIARFLDNFAISGNLARVPYPYRLNDAKAWLRQGWAATPASESAFVVDLRGEGVIGVIGLHEGDDGVAELGYWLGEPFWNRGLMSEAAAGIVDWYFATAPADRLICGAFAFNKASLAIQRKLGFTEISTSQRLCLARREDLRHIDTELTRNAWAAVRLRWPPHWRLNAGTGASGATDGENGTA